MIILFDENETSFSSLGLGVLRDATSCTVKEGLNDEYTLEMEYPVTGNNFAQLQLNRIIYCHPNPYSNAQPFRIYSITKPIKGAVTVSACHISYDMNDIPVGTINGQNIQDALNQIQNGVIVDDSKFKLYTDMTSTKKFKTSAPYNMRAILMGSDESILEKYDAEIRFDKWNAYITKQRGKNRGVQVRYAKNMTDLSHELNYERLYNGVYPFYHKETTSTTSATTTGDFKQVYIVGKKPYQAGWLSYSAGGTAYQPVDESPVQIATDGDWRDKVYCWNSITQRYEEKIYNETVTLVQGVISPDWIKIDWGSLPKIVCQAAADGYFKTTTETTWAYHKSGETVFEGSITDISSLATNMILYYSEVIPSDSTSSSDTDTSITHIELPEKIIWLDTDDAKAMKRDRILMLDLSSSFGDDEDDDDDDEEDTTTSTSTSTSTTTTDDTADDSDDEDDSDIPTVDELRAKAEKYIKKNKIGTIKFETSVSFVDLSATTEKEKYKDFEQVELGDTVKVVYNELGIDIDLRVISTEYDVLKNTYENIELGEKSETLSASSVQNGDNVSSLTNDSDYASTSTVSKLIAKTVTADYIQAQNAKLTSAQITELQTARIKCTGILEASQLELDKLVATLLVADDAEIANTLSAGQIKVAGDISVNSGQISITNGEKVFTVSREGDLTANSVTITGGSLNINNGTFEVTSDGIMSAVGADISGRVQATEGLIGGFTIGENAIYNSITGMEDPTSNGVYLGVDGIKLGGAFSVTSEGLLTSTSGKIGGYTIRDNTLSVGYADTDTMSTGMLAYPAKDVVNISKTGIRVGNYIPLSATKYLDLQEVLEGETAYARTMSTNTELQLTKANNAAFTFKTDPADIARQFKLEFYSAKTDGTKNDAYTVIVDVPANSSSIDKISITYDKTYYYMFFTAVKGDFTNSTMTLYGLYGIILNKGTGQLIANNVKITGGTLNVGDGVFEVKSDGSMTATSANITGTISAKTGIIGGFTINDKGIYSGDITSFDGDGTNGIYICSDGIRVGTSYKITPEGAFSAGNDESGIECGIGTDGKLTAKSAEIVGKITAKSGYIGTEKKGFYIYESCICSQDYNAAQLPTSYRDQPAVSGVYVGVDAVRCGQCVDYRKSGSKATVGDVPSQAIVFELDATWTDLTMTITFDAASAERTLLIQAIDSSGYATGGPMDIEQLIAAGESSCAAKLTLTDEYKTVRIMSDLQSGSGTFTNVTYMIYPIGTAMLSSGKLLANGAQIYGTFDGDVNITGGSLNINNGVFSVDKDGKLTAESAEIVGKITAESGSFGPLTISGGAITMLSDSETVLRFGKVTDPRLPTYYLYSTSVYINKLSLSRYDTVYDESYWLEFRSERTTSTIKSGLYLMYGTETTSAEVHGYISTTNFDKIPTVDTVDASMPVGVNPKIYFGKVNWPANQILLVKKFSAIKSDINKVAAILVYGQLKTFSASIINDEQSCILYCNEAFSTATTVDLMIVYY